jgi:hypothetical protein
MSEGKKALLLIGSPRGIKSSSAALGSYMLKQLNAGGYGGETIHLHPLVTSEDGLRKLASAIADPDIIIFASPLYIDSIPAPVIAGMEYLKKTRSVTKPVKDQRLFALVNGGFPEPSQSATALKIYQQFAKESGFIWAGGLAYASGEAGIRRKPIESLGFMGRNVRKSLDSAAAALAEAKPVPDSAVALSAKPLILVWMVMLIGNRFWKQQVKDHKTWEAIASRPYGK